MGIAYKLMRDLGRNHCKRLCYEQALIELNKTALGHFPTISIFSGPACRKLRERYQIRYRGLEADDDSEHEAERSTNVFDPRHQEINS